MKFGIAVLALLLCCATASADPREARTKLMSLPHADVGRLVGVMAGEGDGADQNDL